LSNGNPIQWVWCSECAGLMLEVIALTDLEVGQVLRLNVSLAGSIPEQRKPVQFKIARNNEAAHFQYT
jgi:hypothetical protein